MRGWTAGGKGGGGAWWDEGQLGQRDDGRQKLLMHRWPGNLWPGLAMLYYSMACGKCNLVEPDRGGHLSRLQQKIVATCACTSLSTQHRCITHHCARSSPHLCLQCLELIPRWLPAPPNLRQPTGHAPPSCHPLDQMAALLGPTQLRHYANLVQLTRHPVAAVMGYPGTGDQAKEPRYVRPLFHRAAAPRARPHTASRAGLLAAGPCMTWKSTRKCVASA